MNVHFSASQLLGLGKLILDSNWCIAGYQRMHVTHVFEIRFQPRSGTTIFCVGQQMLKCHRRALPVKRMAHIGKCYQGNATGAQHPHGGTQSAHGVVKMLNDMRRYDEVEDLIIKTTKCLGVYQATNRNIRVAEIFCQFISVADVPIKAG